MPAPVLGRDGTNGASSLLLERSDGLLCDSPPLADWHPHGAKVAGGLAAAQALGVLAGMDDVDQASGILVEELALEIVFGMVGYRNARRQCPVSCWLRRVREQVEERLREPMTLSDLAQSAGVHPVHLARRL